MEAADINARKNSKAIILSIVGLIISIMAVFISMYQAYVYHGQLKISEYQLKLSENQERTQLRAYVGTVYARISNFEPPNKFTVTVNVKNFGLTPAENINLQYVNKNEGRSDNAIYNTDMSDYPLETGIAIYPSSDVDINNTFFMDMNDIKDFKEDRKVLVFYGLIKYNDIFKMEQASNLCFTFTRDDLNTFVKKAQQPYGVKCRNFNGTD